MNLYNLHIGPESLLLLKEADEYVLDVLFRKYRDEREELRKREKAISVEPYYAFYYAQDVLKRPFPAGEAVIASDAYYAYYYARDVLKGPFSLGEATIAKSAKYAFYYAQDVLKRPFPAGEAAITESAPYAYLYAAHVLKCSATDINAAFSTNP